MTSTGTLMVSVFTSRARIPLENASVSISQMKDKGLVLIAQCYTDRNGYTNPIELETPDIQHSLQPSDVIPFSTFSVAVAVEGYVSMTVNDVQVFPTVRTIQSFVMIPLQEGADPDDKGMVITVPPQDL